MDGINPVEALMLASFCIIFPLLTYGFVLCAVGFTVCATGGDPATITSRLKGISLRDLNLKSTVIAIPIYNENPERVFASISAMVRSLELTGRRDAFKFFVLSDTEDPAIWVREQNEWLKCCQKHGLTDGLHYRRRIKREGGKSGNIEEFCKRWGGQFEYMIVLDADSVMSGETMVRLVQLMERSPNAGIIQTLPQLVRGETLLQRMLQFSFANAAPLFTAGCAFWMLGEGPFWGHNAILRMRAFCGHCGLPDLPPNTPLSGRILSHDTIEALLMREAGYEVWLAGDLPGSYEECPPTLGDLLARDRRWCHGNLQHSWFLFARGISAIGRLHVLIGVMAYLAAPFWGLFLAACVILAATNQHNQDHSVFGITLLGLTLVLLLGPKLLALVFGICKESPSGAFRYVTSFVGELICSVALAPVLMFKHSRFILETLAGRRMTWGMQRRDGSSSFDESVRDFGDTFIVGVTVASAVAVFAPDRLLMFAPVWVGLMVALPLSIALGSKAWGTWARNAGLFITDEDSNPAPILELLGQRGSKNEIALEPSLTPIVMHSPGASSQIPAAVSLACVLSDSDSEPSTIESFDSLHVEEWKCLISNEQALQRVDRALADVSDKN